jgi:hypothetical protein
MIAEDGKLPRAAASPECSRWRRFGHGLASDLIPDPNKEWASHGVNGVNGVFSCRFLCSHGVGVIQ